MPERYSGRAHSSAARPVNWNRSGEGRCARGKRERRAGAEVAGNAGYGNDCNRLPREQLRRGRSAAAERAEPMTERAMFRRRRPGGVGEAGVMIGVLMNGRRGIVVGVVGRVPAAQRARQDEDDRQCDERLGAECQPVST